MTKLNSLKDLLIDELKDLYSAETQLVRALPKLAKAATNAKLRGGFTAHWEQTKGHAERLARACEILGESPRGKTCHAMEGLVAEGQEAIERTGADAVKDASLIGAAQRVEHYEIAAYGTARAFAEAIGELHVAKLLQATLEEEAATDRKLTSLAETVNEEALVGAGQER